MSVGEASIGLNLGTSQLDVDVKTAERILSRIGRGVIENGKQAEKAIAQLGSAGVTSVDRLQKAFSTLNIKTSLDISNEKARIVAAFEQIKRSGVASADEISRAQSAMHTKIAAISSPVSGLAAGLGGLGAAAMAAMSGFSAVAIIGQLHQTGMAVERLRNSFESVTGSAANGASAMEFVRSESKRLGLDLAQTADAYLKLTAASKGTALQGEDTKNIFTAVAGAGRSIGMSAEQMNGALLAIGQMMSKGTVQAEELRGQLGERLPGAFNIAARAMGVSTAELGKMLEGGKVISDEFLPKFAAELQKTFPAGEAAMKGMTAETMRLKTAWFELKEEVMNKGGEGLFTTVIREAGKSLAALKDGMNTEMEWGKNGHILSTRSTAPSKPMSDLEKFYSSASVASMVNPNAPVDFASIAGRSTVDFGANLNRNPAVEIAKATKAARTHLTVIKDLTAEFAKLKKEKEQYDYELGQNLSGQAEAANRVFGLMTGQTGDLKTDRYKVTPLSKYRMMTNDQYSIPQKVGPVEPDYGQMAINKERAAASMSGMNAQLKNLNGDQYGAGLDQINEEKARRDEETAKMLDKGVIMVEEANERKLKSDELYAKSKAQLDKDTAAKALDSLGNSLSSLGETLMQGNKEQFEAGKKMAIAGAMISMTLGAVQAFTAMSGIPYVGPVLGAVAAAAVVAAGMSNIARIESTQYEGREMGGPVRAGQSYIVGEKRPELFTPGASGVITPYVPQGGGASVTQVLQISAGVPDAVRSEMARMLPLIRQQAVSAVQQAQRSGAMQ